LVKLYNYQSQTSPTLPNLHLTRFGVIFLLNHLNLYSHIPGRGLAKLIWRASAEKIKMTGRKTPEKAFQRRSVGTRSNGLAKWADFNLIFVFPTLVAGAKK